MQSTSTPNYYLNSSLKKEKNKLNSIKTKSLPIQMFQLCLVIPERREILQQHLQLSGRRDVHGKPTIRCTSGSFTSLPIDSVSLISHFCVWCFTSGQSHLLRNTTQIYCTVSRTLYDIELRTLENPSLENVESLHKHFPIFSSNN